MIARTYIEASLKSLNRTYQASSSAKHSLFYSKLAILELCGWIEESMDDIILRCARRHLKNATNITFVESQIVNRTYGFDYHKHFRRMLIQLLGVINVERIEKKVDQTKRAQLESTLAALKTVRDAEAHTHIRGATRNINAPSVTLSQFTTLYEGLHEFDTKLRQTKF